MSLSIAVGNIDHCKVGHHMTEPIFTTFFCGVVIIKWTHYLTYGHVTSGGEWLPKLQNWIISTGEVGGCVAATSKWPAINQGSPTAASTVKSCQNRIDCILLEMMSKRKYSEIWGHHQECIALYPSSFHLTNINEYQYSLWEYSLISLSLIQTV